MSTTIEAPLVTPDELLKLDDGILYELVDGQLVEKHMGVEASEVATVLTELLSAFNRKNKVGHVYTETTIMCFPKYPDRIRRPDICLVKAGRFPNKRSPKGHILIAPDLAIEIVSPHDSYYEVEAKASEYLEAGITEVWLINPDLKRLTVKKQGEGDIVVSKGSVFYSKLLSGFSLPLNELFETLE